jgi:molybdopterin-containing oxidoreductase family iron-sulfur binding subunit
MRTWSTLADLARDPSLLHDGELAPAAAANAPAPNAPEPTTTSRRGLLQGIGGLFAASTLAACSRAPKEKILPYNHTPPELVPGVPTTYATTVERDGYARGVLVQLYDGRPVKIEGNPDHPASLGSTSAQEQAEIWRLYDPDRAREVLSRGQPAPYAAMWRDLAARLAGHPRGTGVHLLLPATSSRLIAESLDSLRAALPEAGVHFASYASPRATWEAGNLLYGETRELDVDLAGAQVIAAFDSDLVQQGPAALVHQRSFAAGRMLADPRAGMNRLYVVEPELTVTGSNADHRIAVPRSQVPAMAAALAVALGEGGLGLPPDLLAALAPLAQPAAANARFLEALARDLLAHRATAVIAVGPTQPAPVQALGHLLGRTLGGRSLARVSPVLEAGQPSHDLAALTAAMNRGEVDTLLVLGGNPAYASPARLGFAAALAKVPLAVHLAGYVDETASACRWVVPEAHPFEIWRDGHAFDGTWSIAQPVLQPLTGGRSAVELLTALTDLATGAASPATLGQRSVEAAAKETHRRLQAMVATAGGDWSHAVVRGVASGPSVVDAAAIPASRLAPLSRALGELAGKILAPAADVFELSTPLDTRVHDGSLSNCPWLQELPEPLTKLTWGNAAQLAPSTAARLGLADGDVVTLTVGGESLEAPVRVAPGQALGVVTVSLGFGRRGAESVARDVGVNAFFLATPDGSPAGARLTIERTGRTTELASAQAHFALEGRDDVVVPETTLAELTKPAAPDARPWGADKRGPEETLFFLRPAQAGQSGEHQWGMVIDLNACTGCNACVLACQVENNVPTVGKSGVVKRREMHWLRLDRYFRGPADTPETISQPMLCQHCEKAPCEYVCPVGATNHSSEGLNQMVYNRCVGTRFCSNNCPYKVRRFNWFDYHDEDADIVRLGKNPDVTVRARGVMEKCTFCVQRIRRTQQQAEVAGRPERVDEFTSACAQVCPSKAITFGDIARPGSAVSRVWQAPRAYAVLNELGTEPRVRYAARVRNPNPELST